MARVSLLERRNNSLNRALVFPAGFEPTAPRLGIWCSIQLSYGNETKPATWAFISGAREAEQRAAQRTKD
jgi:hypothetical protein